MALSTIDFTVSEGVATLTLNRPDRLNSFTPIMLEEIATVLTLVEGDAAIRALLITGAGRGFCAGQDLTAGGGASGETMGAIERWYNPMVRRLKSLPKPVLAAVNGVAAGAGANLALTCDLVIAARGASFIEAFARIGLIPDTGGTYYLPRLIGSARAMGLALLGEALPAEQAAAWGLIWKVVDDEKLMSEARSLAAKLAQGPTKGLGLIKEALNRSLENGLE